MRSRSDSSKLQHSTLVASVVSLSSASQLVSLSSLTRHSIQHLYNYYNNNNIIIMSSITLNAAAKILQTELHYDAARAMHFVKQFDKNGDGQLCSAEFEHFKTTIRDTKQQMEAKFKEVDADASGLVSLDEAKAVLRKPPFNFPDEKVKLLMERFDNDKNGQLDVHEFIGFYAEAKAINEDIGRRFDALDADGNGVLSHDELVDVICRTLKYEPSRARQFVDSFDINKDGHIDKKEFVGMWSIMFG